ncbi:MAG: DUF2157 domain-containing protein [Clostridiales bacterium]|nr:DUF2157 domain-containing protein [Clostridiales bacterium]
MAKISKTIKKLRNSRELTQDSLAEQLFVSRQTVSSWETDRTQPDIEMLKKLSEVLDVSIEELIYGEKLRTEENAANSNSKKVLIIIFSVIASVLIGSGLLLIFVSGWKNFPMALKTVFSLAPMLVGQAAALYVYRKHRESPAWREGAAVLWCAGSIATIALVNSIYELNNGFEGCMLIDSLLILPVIYLLDAVSPLIAYYTAVIYYGFYQADISNSPVWLLLVVAMFALGLAYVIKNRKNTADIRHIYSVWISVIAASIIGILTAIALESGIFAMLTSICICLYALDRDGSWNSPYHTIGLLGGALLSVSASFVWIPGYRYVWYEKIPIDPEYVVYGLLCAAVILIGVFIGRRTFLDNAGKIIFCTSAALCAALEFISENSFIMGSFLIYALICMAAVAQALSLIADGAKTGRFLPLNIGLLMIASLITEIIVAQNLGMLATGLMLVVMGIILLFINYTLAKKKKLSEKEVAEDE